MTGNISSEGALSLFSGVGQDILLLPGDSEIPGGQPGRVIVHSDVSLENFKITAETFNATKTLILGNVTMDVASSSFTTSDGDITFTPAPGGRILLTQQS